MPGSGNSLVTWGRCVRLSLLPTALADAMAGFALAGMVRVPAGKELLLFVSSAGIYHGAMALNDWADREKDSIERPERPIPSGAISSGAALLATAALFLIGLLAAATLSLQLLAWMTAISVVAIAYDLRLRGPLLGPMCLGVCRAMHLAAPVIWLAPERLQSYWALPVGYGLYVFTLSRLARLEERSTEDLGSAPTKLLLIQALSFTGPLLYAAKLSHAWFQQNIERAEATNAHLPWLSTVSPMAPIVILALFGGGVLLRECMSAKSWTPAKVQAAVGKALRLMLIFTAASALTAGGILGPIAALLILLGYPLAHSLRKVFPPT